jgi:hypothetical protein
MQEGKSRHASWQELLVSPASAPHVAQIFDSDDFVAAAVALFAAEGLRRGEAVQLTGTQAHLQGVRRALDGAGADTEAALRREQLLLVDAHDAVAAVCDGSRLDPARFEAAAGERLRRASGDARFTGVRWWGEISNVMHQHGNTREALAAENLADRIGRKYGVRIFCSYHLDRFDPAAYDGILREVCCRHSHVIPAEDYVRHRLAVNRAVEEVVGEIRGPLLQSLLSWKGLGCDLPSSQALLFWLRDAMPEHFAAVLSRVKAHHGEALPSV